MGIFSNRCEALVNPITGMALAGVALDEARKVASWPRCGHSVKKGAEFCSKCGAPARGGWVKCPTCGEWVGNDSNFCWNCNTPLHPTDGVAIAGGVWVRNAGVFAQRFEVNNVKVQDGSNLQVQEGTVAVLLSGGAVEEVLDAGSFNIESTARKINWFGKPPPRSVVLMEAGEVALPLSVKDVPTKALEDSGLIAGVLVDFYGEVIVRFRGGKDAAVNFMSNVFKLGPYRREMTLADLSNRLTPCFEQAVREVCKQTTINQLVSDPQVRITLRKHMTDIAERELDASGIELVRISGADFGSRAYDDFLHQDALKAEQRLAEERSRSEQERERAQREFEEKVALDKFRSEQELLREKESIEDEYRMDAAQRKAAWDKLQQKVRADEDEARRKLELDEQKHLQELERLKYASEAERQRAEFEFQERKRQLEDEAQRLQWARAKADRAHKAEIEEEERSRAAAEKIRRQKEEDEDRIRMWALLDEEKRRLWSQEDAVREREWTLEAKKIEHDAAVAEAVMRVGDIKREHDWKVELEAIIHAGECEGRKTEIDLQKAKKVAQGEISVKELWDDYVIAKQKKQNAAEVAIAIEKASGEVQVARVRDEYENEKTVGKAKTDATVSQVKRSERLEDHNLEVKETEDWIEVKRKKLFEKRELLENIKRETDPKVKDMLIEEYRKNYLSDGNGD